MSEKAAHVEPLSVKQVLLNIFPENYFQALAEGNMLQIIFLAVFMGIAILYSKESGRRIARFFGDLNEIVMQLVSITMKLVPYAVFCKTVEVASTEGLVSLGVLFSYMSLVVLILLIQMLVVYPVILRLGCNIPVRYFFKQMFPAIAFAFSSSSSSASIPIVMNVARKKLNLSQSVVSFVIPLGSTINMDGTAIMQGVATVFVANIVGYSLSFNDYLIAIIMIIISSIGTAGVPSAGIIMLISVFSQIGLPLEFIPWLLTVDRLLDMCRTAVNICGDCTVACVIDNMEKNNLIKNSSYLSVKNNSRRSL